MKIASITVTSNRPEIILDAIKSVEGFIDYIIIVDVGCTDNTIDLVKEFAGDRVFVVSGPPKGTEVMRNIGLAAAERMGCDWAVQIDTDERLHANGVDIRSELSKTTANTILVMEDTGKYCKERFFRLPAGRYELSTHEAYRGYGEVGIMKIVRFSELKKSWEQLSKRLDEDLVGLKMQVEAEPESTRWRYYLGLTYELQGHKAFAITEYERCAQMTGNHHERAWACYRAAICHVILGNPEAAIKACAQGWAISPSLAELPHLAGVQWLELGQPIHAMACGAQAASIGHGTPASTNRVGWREPVSLFEGPYEVIAAAYEGLGKNVDQINQVIQTKRAQREAWQRGEIA